MHIVHVANFYGPGSGGVRTFIHALARGYAERGHRMTFIVPGAEMSDVDVEGARRITMHGRRIAFSGGYRMITDVPKVISMIESLEPDGVEVSDRLTLRGVGGWARQEGISSANIAHERIDGVLKAHLKFPDGLATWGADWHNADTAEAFDHIVATTAFAAEEFERIGTPNLLRIPLGVDLEKFHPRNFDPAVRAGYLDDPQQKLLVLPSRLSKEKRPDLAIRAVRELVRRGMRVKLISVGTGPARMTQRMKDLATNLPVEFAGFVPQIPTLSGLVASADVVMAPGPIETFGLAALESLASGTPVVGSNTSALREIVHDGAGLVADPDPRALADAVEEVLHRDEATRRDAARARAEHFDWNSTVEQFLALHQ